MRTACNKITLLNYVKGGMLKYYVNAYNDVVIKDASIPDNLLLFLSELDARLMTWNKIGHSAIWLKLPNRVAGYAPSLFQRGFTAHHCGPTYIMYTLWLKADTPSKLPEYGTHVVRVEALLKRADGRLLMVQERHGAPHWKFVSGSVDPGEHIVAAVVREVQEEVGLQTRFVGIAGIANRTGAKWGRNEIIVLCQVELIDGEDPDALRIQEDEIAKAAWFKSKDVQLYWNIDFSETHTMQWDRVRAFTSDGFMHSHTPYPAAAASVAGSPCAFEVDDACPAAPAGADDNTGSQTPSSAGADDKPSTHTPSGLHNQCSVSPGSP